MPGSTYLDAPLGDAAPRQQAAAAATSADVESPLRVYVLVVDGLLPTQIGTQTPNLSALKTSGTWYAQSRSVLPAETLPNHAAMATGVVPQKNGIVANQITRGHTPKEYMQTPEFWDTDTITTRLERGYHGAIDTATILGKEYLWGLFRGGFEGAGDPHPQREADFHWDPRTVPGYVTSPSSHTIDQYTMDTLLAWLATEDNSPRPQFAFINMADVDRAGHADEEGAVAAAANRAVSGNDELTTAFATPFQQAAIEDADTQIGRFITALKGSGHWDESVLIVLSDHGMDWGPQSNIAQSQAALKDAGYIPNDLDTGAGAGDFKALGGGGSELIYVYDPGNIGPMARVLCEADGIAVVATRQPVTGLNGSKCKGRTLGELGLNHRYSADIEIFLEATWRSSPQNESENPLPGNHGHAVTQHNTLFVTGGSPLLDDEPQSVGGPPVYHQNDVALPGGPGVLSIAPTVAGLFEIGSPAGGYDVPPLTDAFDPGVVNLKTTELVRPTPTGGEEDLGAPDGDGAAAPLLTVGAEVKDATLTQAAYKLYVANRGNAEARDIVLTNSVPASTTFASSAPPPNPASTCAAPNSVCRWSMGDLLPGQSRTIEVTYNLTGTTTQVVSNTVSAQIGGAAPDSATDPKDTDATLERRIDTLTDDAHVDRAAPADKNYGACAQLDIGQGNSVAAFLDDDSAFRDEYGATSLTSRTDTLYAAELQASVKTVTSADGTPVDIGAHRISSPEWKEGFGDCNGTPATATQPTSRDAGSGAVPTSDPGTLASRGATTVGERLTWDITRALDSPDDRRDFNGLELRLAGDPLPATDAVSLHSAEATPAANQPRFVFVRTIDKEKRCVSADPEAATRDSDQVQRVRAYVTKTGTSARQTTAGADVCNGTPVAGAPVGWEIDDDSPDAYFSSLAGHPTERETGANGGVSPDRGSTVTGPTGRTFVDLRLADQHPSDEAPASTRVAAIALSYEHDAYFIGEANRTSQGTCEPGEPAAFASGGSCSGTGEALNEDDVATTWKPVPAPPSGGGTGTGGSGSGGSGTGGANDIDGIDGGTGTSRGDGTANRAGDSNTAPKRGRVRIARGRLKMNSKRIVPVTLICPKKPRGGCAGTVSIRYRRHAIAKRRYEFAAGKRQAVPVKVRKAAARKIRRHRTVRVRVRATSRQHRSVSRRARLTH